MAKVLACRDVGVDCDFVACGDTEEDVMKLTAEHGRNVHGMEKLTPEIEEKVRAAIHDEKVECR